ncbi:MAG: hypothetical protein WC988_00420 [Patescibacteria group bacterium]
MTILEMQKEIVSEFKWYDAGKSRFNLLSYLGTQNKLYHLKNAQEKKIAKDFLNRHKILHRSNFWH